MDKLFSNIKEGFNGSNNEKNCGKEYDDLLEKQRKTEKKNKDLLAKQRKTEKEINDLLEKASESVLCGPSCQKERKTAELKRKYLDSKTNMLTAPIDLEQNKKNYFVFKEGRAFYDDMIEKELTEKVNKISELLVENFNDGVSNANTMNIYLNSALINSQNTKELLEKYLQQNELLKVKLTERHGDILTNDRKTYYEVEALDRLQVWYTFLWYIYYIIVIIFQISLIFVPNDIGLVKSLIMGVLLVFYPYYIGYIVTWIYGLFKTVTSGLPKNVYNDL